MAMFAWATAVYLHSGCIMCACQHAWICSAYTHLRGFMLSVCLHAHTCNPSTHVHVGVGSYSQARAHFRACLCLCLCLPPLTF